MGFQEAKDKEMGKVFFPNHLGGSGWYSEKALQGEEHDLFRSCLIFVNAHSMLDDIEKDLWLAELN